MQKVRYQRPGFYILDTKTSKWYRSTSYEKIPVSFKNNSRFSLHRCSDDGCCDCSFCKLRNEGREETSLVYKKLIDKNLISLEQNDIYLCESSGFDERNHYHSLRLSKFHVHPATAMDNITLDNEVNLQEIEIARVEHDEFRRREEIRRQHFRPVERVREPDANLRGLPRFAAAPWSPPRPVWRDVYLSPVDEPPPTPPIEEIPKGRKIRVKKSE